MISNHTCAPSPSPSPENSEADSNRLYQRAIAGLSDALHILRNSSSLSGADLRHALGRGTRAVTALKRLAALSANVHPGRDGISEEQAHAEFSTPPTFLTPVLPKKRRRRRYFEQQYKRQVAQLIRKQHLSISQASKELNLTYSAVRRWLLEFDAQQASCVNKTSGKTTAVSPAAPPLPDAEQRIGQLEERLQQLQADNELLKKASALFVREIYSPSAQG